MTITSLAGLCLTRDGYVRDFAKAIVVERSRATVEEILDALISAIGSGSINSVWKTILPELQALLRDRYKIVGGERVLVISGRDRVLDVLNVQLANLVTEGELIQLPDGNYLLSPCQSVDS